MDNDTIKSRATAYSRRLLDILAKLDSKASDDLGGVELEATLEMEAG